MKALEDKAHAGKTQTGELPVGKCIEPGSQQFHTPRGRRVYAADQLEQGRLSTSGWTGYSNVLARLHFQRCTAERVHSHSIHRIVLVQVPSSQDRTAHVASERRVAAIGARAASQAG